MSDQSAKRPRDNMRRGGMQTPVADARRSLRRRCEPDSHGTTNAAVALDVSASPCTRADAIIASDDKLSKRCSRLACASQTKLRARAQFGGDGVIPEFCCRRAHCDITNFFRDQGLASGDYRNKMIFLGEK